MDGVFVVNKPRDITSFGVCALIRKLTGTKRTGHTGTLDPMATGVLVVCTGSAGRLIEYMPEKVKRYTAGIAFGYVSDTQDIWGSVEERTAPSFDLAQLEKAMSSLTGTYMQKTPAFSARKVNGRALYSYARAGEDVPPIDAFMSNDTMTGRFLTDPATVDTAVPGVYALSLEAEGEPFDLSAYADQDRISDWAADGVALCSSLGILRGSDGQFRPGEPATRALAAAVLARLDGLGLKEAAEAPSAPEEPATGEEAPPEEELAPTEEIEPTEETEAQPND